MATNKPPVEPFIAPAILAAQFPNSSAPLPGSPEALSNSRATAPVAARFAPQSLGAGGHSIPLSPPSKVVAANFAEQFPAAKQESAMPTGRPPVEPFIAPASLAAQFPNSSAPLPGSLEALSDNRATAPVAVRFATQSLGAGGHSLPLSPPSKAVAASFAEQFPAAKQEHEMAIPPTSAPFAEQFSRALTVFKGKRRKLVMYVPNNNALYNAALCGFMAGVHLAKFLVDSDPADYTGIVDEAQQFAIEVDQAIPAATPNASQAQLVFGLAESSSAYRYTTNTPATSYAQNAAAIAAAYSKASLGLTPLPAPGGGPWEQTGGVGTVIDTIDVTAPIQGAGGVANSVSSVAFGANSLASGIAATAFGGGSALGNNSFAVAGGYAPGYSAMAMGGVAEGDSSFAGPNSSAIGYVSAGFCAGSAWDIYDFAVGYGSFANNGTLGAGLRGAAAFGGGTATVDGAFACAESFASGFDSTALSRGNASGICSCAVASGVAYGDFSFAASNAVSTGAFSSAFATGIANGVGSFAASGGTASGWYDFAIGGGSMANNGTVGPATGCIAMAGGLVTADHSAAIGACSVSIANAYKLGDDGASQFSANDDAAGTTSITCGANQNLAIVNVATQGTVGAAGGASPLPLSPDGYLLITVGGVQKAIPLFANV